MLNIWESLGSNQQEICPLEVYNLTQKNQTDYNEEGIDVPYENFNPDTLRNMVEEFVTREWSDLCDSGYTLENKIEQVLQQLKEKKVKVVFDFSSSTANIVVYW